MPTQREIQKAGRTRLQSLVDRYHRNELARNEVIRQCEELAGCAVELKDDAARKNWVQVIIKEGLEPLLKLAGGPSYEVWGPFGLFCELVIHCKGHEHFSLRVRLPDGAQRGYFLYEDTRTALARFKPGTVGAVNGGNGVFRPFPIGFTVAHLIRLVQSRRAFKAFLKARDIRGPGWRKTVETNKTHDRS